MYNVVMFTMHKHDYTEVKRQRKRKRDVIREQKLAQFGIEPIDITGNEPLSAEVRLERIRLLSYEYSKRQHGLTDEQIEENQRLKRRRKDKKRPKGENRSALQFLQRRVTKIRSMCKKEGIPCNITADDFVMPEICPVLGIKIEWGAELVDGTPSFDRFDPDGGYVKGNVRIISMRANRLKSNATLADLKAIVAWMEKTDKEQHS
jgi:hypothetical protein